VLSGEQVERLLAAAPPSYRTLFLTAVSTGVRLGELRALRWADVDWNRDQPRLHVRGSVSKSGGSRCRRRRVRRGRSPSGHDSVRRSWSIEWPPATRTTAISSSRTRTARPSTGTTSQSASSSLPSDKPDCRAFGSMTCGICSRRC